MIDQTFDTLTRQALLAMPGAFNRTALPEPITTNAKGERRKNRAKNRKRCKTGCKPQVESCRTFLAPACAGSPRCPALIDCCEALGSCDATGFVTCLLDVTAGGN